MYPNAYECPYAEEYQTQVAPEYQMIPAQQNVPINPQDIQALLASTVEFQRNISIYIAELNKAVNSLSEHTRQLNNELATINRRIDALESNRYTYGTTNRGFFGSIGDRIDDFFTGLIA